MPSNFREPLQSLLDTVRLSRRALLLGALAGPTLAACSAVGTFNAVVPFDDGSLKIADGIAYGEHPRQKLDLYAPPTGTNLPTILFIYGGAWNAGSRAEYAFAGRALASRGFLVAVADYRLYPEVRYPDFLIDNALALKWMRENASAQRGNSNKLVIMGHSAGAYNAIEVALDPSLTRLVGLRGQVLKGAIGLAGPYDFLPLDVPESVAAFGSWPRLAETQPINHVSRFAPPMFLATGDADTTVFPRNTVALAKKLRAAGVPVEEHSYHEVTHAGILTALSRPFRDNAPVLDQVTAFVNRVTA